MPVCPSEGRLGYFISSNRKTAILETAFELRNLLACAAHVLEEALAEHQKYEKKLSKWIQPAWKEYNEQYWTHGENVEKLKADDFKITGEHFPGRPQQRPCIRFLNAQIHPEVAKEYCSENYNNSLLHSPGLFTALCACQNLKLLRVVVMDLCESVCAALSVLISRFKKLPKVVYYDNASNLSKSYALRCGWVPGDSYLVCDRFYYKSHMPSKVFDPESYAVYDTHRTSGTEALNSRWAS